MKKTTPKKSPSQKTKAMRAAHQLAEQAADRYFAAIASDIPFDDGPGDLIAVVNHIQDTLGDEVDVDSALRAGYVLGVAVGKRLAGGAR